MNGWEMRIRDGGSERDQTRSKCGLFLVNFKMTNVSVIKERHSARHVCCMVAEWFMHIASRFEQVDEDSINRIR